MSGLIWVAAIAVILVIVIMGVSLTLFVDTIAKLRADVANLRVRNTELRRRKFQGVTQEDMDAMLDRARNVDMEIRP